MIVNCGKRSQCNQLSVFANNSNSVTINCTDTFQENPSCTKMNVYGQNSNKMTILCDGDESCEYSNFYCPYIEEEACELSCKGEYSCNYTKVWVPEDYRFDYLDLQCIQGGTGCDKLSFNCIGTDPLVSSTWQSSNTSANWMCDSYGYDACCPWHAGGELVYRHGMAAHVYCDEAATPCINAIINATTSSSLTVTCTTNNISYCNNVKVYCPMNGNCDIICEDDEACLYMDIIAAETADSNANVSLVCNGDCHSITIDAEYAKFVGFICNESKCGLIGINANSSDKIDIKCVAEAVEDYNITKYYGCKNLSVNADHTKDFDLKCANFGACYKNIFHVNNAENIYIFSINTHALYQTEIYSSYTNQLHMNCVANAQKANSSCTNSALFLPSNAANVDIDCYGKACGILDLFALNNTHNISDISLGFYSCNQCWDPSDCITKINIHCADAAGGQRDEFYYGDKCTAVESNRTDCGCDHMKNNTIFTNSTISNPGHCSAGWIASPTAAPTVFPILAPTAAPTIAPTEHQP